MNDSECPIQLFSTDIEDTILGDPVAAREFLRTWEALDAAPRPLLVYNTGHSISDTQWLVLEGRLPSPDFIIGAIGTELQDPVDAHAGEEYRASLASGWDQALVDRIVECVPGVRLRPAEFSNPCKSSWHWHLATAADLAHLRFQLEQAGLQATVSYTGGVFLDVMPRQSGKGNALRWLCRRIGVPLEHVLVAGASANNGSKFALPGVRGILVGNTSRELFAAAGPFGPWVTAEKLAAGVLAGLHHFGVLETADELAGL